MTGTSRRVRVLEAASLVVGPALMSIGDLMHPAESNDPAAQAAIVMQSASHWFEAHLLLFIGFLLVIPGMLALSRLTMERRPGLGYASRLLVLAGLGGFSAVVVFEMLVGRVAPEGGDLTAVTVLLRTFFSPVMMMAVGPALLAFFVGTGLFVGTLASTAGPCRWPALIFGLGALLILGEIILAEVLLSQIGNILVFLASTAFARLLLRNEARPVIPTAASPRD